MSIVDLGRSRSDLAVEGRAELYMVSGRGFGDAKLSLSRLDEAVPGLLPPYNEPRERSAVLAETECIPLLGADWMESEDMVWTCWTDDWSGGLRLVVLPGGEKGLEVEKVWPRGVAGGESP